MKKENEIKTKPTIRVVIDELNERYDFRYNVVRNKPEYSEKNKNQFKEVNDSFINSRIIYFKNSEIKCTHKMIETILISELVEEYNPFKNYFYNLPKWKEDQESEIDKLINTISTTNNEFWKLSFKRWIIATVACAINDKDVNQQVIVFSGRQGLGKSTWIERLIPEQLNQYSFSGTIKIGNKDTLINLSECLLINLDELTNLNKKETGNLKAIITKSSINLRRPFGKSNELSPRRASFIGSINDPEFLYDETGSRRFLCFDVKHIDYEHDLNIDLVYAEALYLLKQGEKWYFDEVELIEKNNEVFRIRSWYEEEISKRFSPTPIEPIKKQGLDLSKLYMEMRPSDVYREIIKEHRPFRSGELGHVGRVLKKLKFEDITKGGKKYFRVYTIPKVLD